MVTVTATVMTLFVRKPIVDRYADLGSITIAMVVLLYCSSNMAKLNRDGWRLKFWTSPVVSWLSTVELIGDFRVTEHNERLEVSSMPSVWRGFLCH